MTSVAEPVVGPACVQKTLNPTIEPVGNQIRTYWW